MMKKSIRVLATILACVMLSAVFAFSTSAASNVTYNGNAGTFIFAPGGEHSPTDLFADFKQIMPGGTYKQEILINNDVDNGVKVTLYMRALGETEGADSKGFLEQLTITVAAKDGEELFKAPANEPAPVDDWVCLGTFYSGAAVTLDVTLHFPIEAGDDTQNAVGFVDWEFKAEEYPPEPDDPTPTGDNTRIAIFACIAIVAVVAVIAVEIKQRRREA